MAHLGSAGGDLMASLTDVETALVTAIDAALYPTGQAGSPPQTVAGVPARIFSGWPDQVQLDKDLRAGTVNVNVFPRPGMEKNTTRFFPDRQDSVIPAATYTLIKSGLTVTIGGAAPGTYFAQNLAIVVNGRTYTTQATSGQTPASLAAILGSAIVQNVAGVTVTGAAINFTSSARIGDLRVGVTGSSIREVRRQSRQFQIGVWAHSPTVRDAVTAVIDPILADTPRLNLADGAIGALTYVGSIDDDFTQKQLLWRRSLIYAVEYATTITDTAAQMVAGTTTFTNSNGDTLATINT
jgi:hypothetical protein